MSDNQTLTTRPLMWALLAAVVVGGLFYLGGKWMEGRDLTPATISVSGDGRVFAAPDIAELTFGMQTGPKRTAKEAMTMLRDTMNKVIAAVEKEGIPKKDISTQSFQLSPQYDWNDGRQTLRGYEGSETLRVKVRDLDKVSAVLEAATAAGANQAGDVQFTIDDPEKQRAEAREEAIEEAQAKARTLAAQLGKRLGKLRGFDEGGGYSPPMPYREMNMKVAEDSAAAGQAVPSVPLPQGEQEINVTVNLVYELN